MIFLLRNSCAALYPRHLPELDCERLADRQCGYILPRDNHFARTSRAYAFLNASPVSHAWLSDLLSKLQSEARRYRALVWQPATDERFD
jgi:hypothetical protein